MTKGLIRTCLRAAFGTNAEMEHPAAVAKAVDAINRMTISAEAIKKKDSPESLDEVIKKITGEL